MEGEEREGEVVSFLKSCAGCSARGVVSERQRFDRRSARLVRLGLEVSGEDAAFVEPVRRVSFRSIASQREDLRAHNLSPDLPLPHNLLQHASKLLQPHSQPLFSLFRALPCLVLLSKSFPSRSTSDESGFEAVTEALLSSSGGEEGGGGVRDGGREGGG